MPPSYKGAITFGLVYIPVILIAAVKENDVSFNLLERNTMSRVQYKKTCVDCGGREVAQGDIVKGYQYEKDKYVVFENADFEKIKSPRDKNITIQSFVDVTEVDPIYFDRAFYVEPTGGEKAYALLLAAMQKTGKAGIAKTVLGTKEALIMLRAGEGRMLVNTLYFHDEIKRAPAPVEEDANSKELDLAASLLKQMSGKFAPETYRDEYNEKLKAAIKAKIDGREIIATREAVPDNVVNLMEALTKSLALTQKKAVNK